MFDLFLPLRLVSDSIVTLSVPSTLLESLKPNFSFPSDKNLDKQMIETLAWDLLPYNSKSLQ
jgi:hypothetical protein